VDAQHPDPAVGGLHRGRRHDRHIRDMQPHDERSHCAKQPVRYALEMAQAGSMPRASPRRQAWPTAGRPAAEVKEAGVTAGFSSLSGAVRSGEVLRRELPVGQRVEERLDELWPGVAKSM